MEYNEMQLLKREMYAMRNGIIADTLRKAGSHFSIIFGLNLPQLAEISSHFPKDKMFAQTVWDDRATRESMLIAPMLMPAEQFSQDEAINWIDSAPENEVTDVLCLKLLRSQPYALDLAIQLSQSPDPRRRYAGLRLMCNLAPSHRARAVEMGQKNKEHPLAQILLSYSED